MIKKKVFIIFGLFCLIGLVNSSSVILSNISAEYELCVYTPSGYLEGCANNTNSINFSKNDFIFQLKHPDIDLYNKPLTIFNWFPTIIGLLAVILLIVIFTVGISGGFGKVFKKI